MFRLLLIILFGLSTNGAFALDTAALIQEAPCRVLLEKKCIEDEQVGFLAVPFEEAVDLLNDPALPLILQEQKKHAGGKVPEFSIRAMTPSRYCFINEDGEPTDLQVLYRNQTDDNTYDIVVHGEGHRYFGDFEVLTHLQIIRAGDTGVIYRAKLHAYPHRATTRFIARRINAVQDNFKRNTDRLILLAGLWMDRPRIPLSAP